MSFPAQEWRRRIDAARESLLHHPHHDLSYPHVMGLVALFGPRLSIDHNSPLTWNLQDQDPLAVRGWQRRAWNAILCAERSVDFCAPIASVAELKATLLEAKKVVVGREPLKARFLGLPFSSDDLSSEYPLESEMPREIYRATSAYLDLEMALLIVAEDVDNHFSAEMDYKEDQGGDYWTAPNVIYVSRTFGGSYWGSFPLFVNDLARHDFWLWWLDKALPASWNLRDL